MPLLPRLLPAATLLLATAAAAQNVPPPATPFHMTGNIYLPNKLPATDARVAALKVPAGFTITKYAEGLDMPRMLAVMPNGDLYVSNRVKGTITLVRDANRDGKAEVKME